MQNSQRSQTEGPSSTEPTEAGPDERALPRVRYVKVFGERNCGTNWCVKNLSANSRAIVVSNKDMKATRRDAVRERLGESGDRDDKRKVAAIRHGAVDEIYATSGFETYGWKHCALDEEQLRRHQNYERTAFVCMVKHPVWFLSSLFVRPHAPILGVPGSLEEFVDYPWQTYGRENLGGVMLDSPIDLWNIKVRSYFDFSANNERVMIVRYEDMLADPAAFFARVGALGVPMRRRQEIVGSDKRGELSLEEYRDKYSDENMRASVPLAVREAVEKRADAELVERLGYKF